MDRPTRERVDTALWAVQSGQPLRENAEVLAAETRALRVELEALQQDARVVDDIAEWKALRATIARIEALLPQTCCAGTAHGDLVLALHRALKPCANYGSDIPPISTPDGQAEEVVVLENPAKQRGKLL